MAFHIMQERQEFKGPYCEFCGQKAHPDRICEKYLMNQKKLREENEEKKAEKEEEDYQTHLEWLENGYPGHFKVVKGLINRIETLVEAVVELQEAMAELLQKDK